MDRRPVFLIITANGCGACNRFKSENLKLTSERATKLGKVRFIHINLGSLGTKIDYSKYPEFLRKIVRWFPMFILINGSCWNEKSQNPSCFVFNANIENGEPKMDMTNSLDPTAENLIKWVESKLNLFNNTQPVLMPVPEKTVPTQSGLKACKFRLKPN